MLNSQLHATPRKCRALANNGARARPRIANRSLPSQPDLPQFDIKRSKRQYTTHDAGAEDKAVAEGDAEEDAEDIVAVASHRIMPDVHRRTGRATETTWRKISYPYRQEGTISMRSIARVGTTTWTVR